MLGIFSGSLDRLERSEKPHLGPAGRIECPAIKPRGGHYSTRPIRWRSQLEKIDAALEYQPTKQEPKVRDGQEDSIFLL
jgi:hypothetical protein